jgi:hypothetical protein
MSNTYGPRIITDGLVLHLDAANNRSYVSGSNTWNDLSGNKNNGSLTNGPTFSTGSKGSIVLDGVDDYVSTSLVYSSNIPEMTMVGYIRRNGTQPSWAGIFYSRMGSNGYGLGFSGFYQNNLTYTWGSGASTYGFNSGLAVPNSTWCMVAMSLNAASVTLYLNTSSSGQLLSHESVSSINNFNIGSDSVEGSRKFRGDIGLMTLYNRALSRSEVFQNYNATKGRFGL